MPGYQNETYSFTHTAIYDGSSDESLLRNEYSCRGIAWDSGTVVVTGLDGVDVTLPAWMAGKLWPGQFTALKATSTATSIMVGW